MKISTIIVASIAFVVLGDIFLLNHNRSKEEEWDQSTQVKDAGPDQQGLLVMNLCGLGLGCLGFDCPSWWL